MRGPESREHRLLTLEQKVAMADGISRRLRKAPCMQRMRV